MAKGINRKANAPRDPEIKNIQVKTFIHIGSNDLRLTGAVCSIGSKTDSFCSIMNSILIGHLRSVAYYFVSLLNAEAK